MYNQIMVLGNFGPGHDGIGLLLVLLGRPFGCLVLVNCGAQEDQVRCASNEAGRAIFQPQLAYLPTQFLLEPGYADQRPIVGDGRVGYVPVIFRMPTFGYDRLSNGIEALASSNLPYQVGYLMLGIVEDGLDEGLKGRVVGFEVVDILLVDAFATVIGIGIVYTLGSVDGGTSSATREVSIALDR